MPRVRSQRLTVLVPARNAEELIPGWLENVRGFADSVVALDDGSNDHTRELLLADPLVEAVLTNPVRSTYAGWDDFENRQRLVHAALASKTDWCFFLDADERMAEDDADALRRFVDAEAQPGFAYGFEIFRLVEDASHFDPAGLWVYRLFAADADHSRLREGRLHFVPIPDSIPRERWLPTSIRLQHSGSLDKERRHARYAKYLEADPNFEFQSDYRVLLDSPQVVESWSERDTELPLLLGPVGRYADQAVGDGRFDEEIAITAVVIAQNDAHVIETSIAALVGQQLDEPFEVILVGSGCDETISKITRMYPQVRCLQLPEAALPGEARNAGLWAAQGEYVTFPGSHVWLTPGSLVARVDSHDQGWDLVTGSVVNGNVCRAGWASYFLDHASQLPDRPSGPFVGVVGHASYVTDDVRSVGGFPEDMRAGEDTVVNKLLYEQGKRAFFRSEASFHHASPATSMKTLCIHHFRRGRGLGRMMRGQRSRLGALRRVPETIWLPSRRLRALRKGLGFADRDMLKRYRRTRTMVVGGALASAVGTAFELGLGRPHLEETSRRPFQTDGCGDRPILALGGRSGEAAFGLLCAGSAAQAASRLATFVKYARSQTEVIPALAPIVSSAMITRETHGSQVMHSWDGEVQAHLDAARAGGAGLILQVQPGAADLADIVDWWSDVLAEPDVGLLVDLRPEVAFRGQVAQLCAVIAQVMHPAGTEAHPVKARVLVRGVGPDALADGAAVADFLDLRTPGTPFPHELFGPGHNPHAVVYQ